MEHWLAERAMEETRKETLDLLSAIEATRVMEEKFKVNKLLNLLVSFVCCFGWSINCGFYFLKVLAGPRITEMWIVKAGKETLDLLLPLKAQLVDEERFTVSESQTFYRTSCWNLDFTSFSTSNRRKIFAPSLYPFSATNNSFSETSSQHINPARTSLYWYSFPITICFTLFLFFY